MSHDISSSSLPLLSIPTVMSRSIQNIQRLASDLDQVDLSLINDKISVISKYEKEDDRANELSRACEDMSDVDPQWQLLAGRVAINHMKQTLPPTFSSATEKLSPNLDEKYLEYVRAHADTLNSIIQHSRDNRFNLFAFHTLKRSYLARLKSAGNTRIYETPQYLFLRVAVFLWFNSTSSLEGDLVNIKKVYDDLSLGRCMHASPTLFNSGLKRHQLASCFTMSVNDNMSSITKSWRDSAFISMNSGGIGIDFSSLRHSEMGHHGETRGIVPWLKIENDVLCAVDQGGKRKGSGTAYLGCWHKDIFEFLELRNPTGPEDMRARDMFYGLWVSDLFMRRVENDGKWTLMCPKKAKDFLKGKGLEEMWGLEFETHYRACEIAVESGNISHARVIDAKELWGAILKAQIETGMPFMLYKDAINRKTNHQNLGTIRLSNLCTEITLFTDEKNIGSCNLASIALNSCVKDGVFDYSSLEEITRQLVRNVNQVIDRNYYPKEVPEIKETNLRTRPLGIGVQGLSDVFALMDIGWDSEDAAKVNSLIFETMYYAAVDESANIAEKLGAYGDFEGSPMSKGLFQFDMWDIEEIQKTASLYNQDDIFNLEKLSQLTSRRGPASDRYDWESLRKKMMGGMRNSLLIALMPTASSASILGNNECFEPHTTHIYARTVLSGQFKIINKHLVKDFKEIGLWNTDTLKHLYTHGGSIQDLPGDHPRLDHLKKKYKTSFELKQRVLADMALERGRYVCQTQSFNCWMIEPTRGKLSAFHKYNWKNGAKTGMYYLRQAARTDPINFAADSVNVPSAQKNIVCTDDVCISCSA